MSWAVLVLSLMYHGNLSQVGYATPDLCITKAFAWILQLLIVEMDIASVCLKSAGSSLVSMELQEQMQM